MPTTNLQVYLETHKKWLEGEKGGVKADLSEANLSDADLSGADLSEADLRRANLRGADLTGTGLVVYQPEGIWTAYITATHVRVGCRYYALEAAFALTDEEIARISPTALEWWNTNKTVIKAIADRLQQKGNK